MSGTIPQDATARRLAVAVEEFLAARRRGENPGIEEFAAGHGEIAAALRETLPALVLLERLAEPAATPAPAWPFSFGDFRVLREIGRGGMGVVYEAEQVSLRRRVALKVLPETRFADPVRQQRFQREAEAAARLDHPGICGVLAAGIEEGIAYIAMRFVDGQTLAQMLAQREPATVALSLEAGSAPGPASDGLNSKPWPTTAGLRTAGESLALVRILEAVAWALHAAHEAGIIHRDVKPANIMMTPEGRPVLLDFGLARIIDAGADLQTLTRTGDVFGTPAYMAPEQVVPEPGRVADRRADVWGLGVVLYECLSGQRPFMAPTQQALAHAILNEEPPPIRVGDRRLARDLSVVVSTALEKDPVRRYQTARDFAEDLRRVLSGEPVLARPTPWWARPVRWARRRPLQATLAGTIVLTLVLLGSFAGFYAATLPKVEQAEAAEREDEVEQLLLQGYFERAEGDAGVAIHAFERALEIEPECQEAVAGLALTLAMRGDRLAAMAVLERHQDAGGDRAPMARLSSALRDSADGQPLRPLSAEADAPPSAVGCFLEAQVLLNECGQLSSSDARKASFLAQQAHLLAPRARPIYLLTLAHAATHVPDTETKRMTENVISVNGTTTRGLAYYHASLLASLGRNEAAEAVVRSALLRWPGAPLLRRGLAAVLVNRKEFAAAAAMLEEAMEGGFAGNWNEWELLGRARSRMGDQPGAVTAFSRVLDFPGVSAAVLGNAEVILAGTKDEERVIDALRRAVVRSPTAAPYRIVLGRALARLGRFPEAAVELQEAVRLDPRSYEAHANLAAAFEASGSPAEAIASWRESLHCRPESAHAHNDLGCLLQGRAEIENACHHFEEAARLQPREPDSWRKLAFARFLLGRYAEASAAAERSIEVSMSGGSTPLYADWEIASFRNHAKQEKDLQAWHAGRFVPGSPAEWIALARILEGKSAFRSAVRFCDEAVRVGTGGSPAETADLKIRAAASALAVGAGLGSDASWTGPTERVEHQDRAATSLGEIEALIVDPDLRTEILRKMSIQLQDLIESKRFAAVREPKRTASLPDDVRGACESFWNRIRSLQDRIEATLEERD